MQRGDGVKKVLLVMCLIIAVSVVSAFDYSSLKNNKIIRNIIIPVTEEEKAVLEEVNDYEIIKDKLELTEKEKAKRLNEKVKKFEYTTRAAIIEKSLNVVNKDGKTITEIRIVIKPKKPMFNVRHYESIPKTLIQNVDEVIFYNTNYTIIKPDPLVVWYFAEIKGGIELVYGIQKEIGADNLEEIKTLLVAEDIGVNFRSFLPFILVPILGIMLIYATKSITLAVEKSRESEIKEIADFIIASTKKGVSKENIISELKKAGWPEKTITKAFK